MAEGAPLLREYVVCSCIEGSNPSLTAIHYRPMAFFFLRSKKNVIYFTTSFLMNEHRASLAQLDRVPGYEPGGRRFESSRARHYLGFSSYKNVNPDIDKSFVEN